jgi:hypothetical protein
MKRIALTIALTLAAGAALAGGTNPATLIDFTNLSPEQLDALTSILAGLPRS